jgi:hypothetical protein
MVVHFVDIDGIVDHHYLSFLFIITFVSEYIGKKSLKIPNG